MTYNNVTYRKNGNVTEKQYDFMSVVGAKNTPSKNGVPEKKPRASVVGALTSNPKNVEKTKSLSEKNSPKTKDTKQQNKVKSGQAVSKKEKEKEVKSSGVKIRTVKVKSSNPFPTAVVFSSIICTLLFMFMLVNMVQRAELADEMAQMQKSLDKLVQLEKEYTLELEKKNDLRVIEEIATEKLGMVKKDQLPKKYVNIDNEDKVVAYKKDDDKAFESLTTMLSAAGQNFKEFLEYID